MVELDCLAEARQLDDAEDHELRALQVDILALSKLQNSMQWQKSRVQWLKEGDANTKFFHGIMNSRKRGNSIVSFNVDGRVLEGVAEVRKHVFDHFKHHFRKVNHNRMDIGSLPFSILSSSDGDKLVQPFLMEEIKAAVWDCDSYKSPGPDGVNLGFFKDFWEILKIDLLNFFAEFHRQGILTKGLNSTFITLIPKVANPQRVAEFRPIALVSSIYKILAKVLANRLRSVIGKVVSHSQSAFISGRQILDGVLIANELVDEAKREKKELLMFKVDFEKAYDSVDWDYLDDVMKTMHFPVLWRKWIMECVSTASASVLVNGSPTDEFSLERGLRQGDPLSPFLFLLAAEGLHVLMEAMKLNDVFTPYS
ncbi:LINE-1 reverse transcriptase like, partial [Trifolium medium]|nr:LINE-1 reverse transcriptase like [Trifolium medium]